VVKNIRQPVFEDSCTEPILNYFNYNVNIKSTVLSVLYIYRLRLLVSKVTHEGSNVERDRLDYSERMTPVNKFCWLKSVIQVLKQCFDTVGWVT